MLSFMKKTNSAFAYNLFGWIQITILLLCLLAGEAIGQLAETSRPFGHTVRDWSNAFAKVDQYFRNGVFDKQTTQEHRRSLTAVANKARKIRERAATELENAERMISVFGPSPKEGEPAETDDIALKRVQFERDISLFRSRMQQAELAIARSVHLDAALSNLMTSKLLGDLLREQPSVFEVKTYKLASEDAVRMVNVIADAPGRWWSNLLDTQRFPGRGFNEIIVLLLIVFMGWGSRRYLLHRFGKKTTISSPSYTQRLISAIGEGVARGIVPSMFFAGLIFTSVSPMALFEGLFGEIVCGLSVGIILFLTVSALVRAILAPEMPNWQLFLLQPVAAIQICRRVTVLAAICGVDISLRFLMDDLSAGDAFQSLYSVTFNTAEGVIFISLCRRTLWKVSSEISISEEVVGRDSVRSRAWNGFRAVIIIFIIVSIVASWLGYSKAGNFINANIFISLTTLAILYMLRGLLREFLSMAIRSSTISENLAVSLASRNKLQFWLRLTLDTTFVLLGLVFIAAIWGVPHEELTRLAYAVVAGFNVGSIRVSLLDIVVALLLFAGLLAITRIIQRILSERLLPETQLEPGIQHSITAGFGYVGIVVATAIGITTLGIDLSNLAIIAGALSVGIGFGLQNIVNNFVSGLIILIERPIKVGDWVVVDGNEGLIRRISVRATEIQTFQRATVIVPNAQFLSNSLTNWTHKDRNGRIEIAVGVAYGSDVKHVEEILLKIAAANKEVVSVPEPFVLFLNFGGSSLDFELRCYTENITRRLRIASSIRYEIDTEFRKKNIEIPFPQRVVHLPSSN